MFILNINNTIRDNSKCQYPINILYTIINLVDIVVAVYNSTILY